MGGEAALIRLRDLPGVQRATDLCRNPRNFDYPQGSYTAHELAQISISLFGITAWDTHWDEAEGELAADEAQERLEYEQKYQIERLPWSEAEPFWRVIGWDISDGSGAELISAHAFARQIIAVEGELVEGAKFTPDGSGVWTPDEEDLDEDSLEERLRREADAFVKGRS